MLVGICVDFRIQSAQFEFSVICQSCQLTLHLSNLSLIFGKRGFYFSVLQNSVS